MAEVVKKNKYSFIWLKKPATLKERNNLQLFSS